MPLLYVDLVLICIVGGLLLVKRDKQAADRYLLMFAGSWILADLQELVFPTEEISVIQLFVLAVAPVFFWHHMLCLFKVPIRRVHQLSYLIPLCLLGLVLFVLIGGNADVFEGYGFRVLLFTTIFLMVGYGIAGLVLAYTRTEQRENVPVQTWARGFSWIYVLFISSSVILSMSANDANAQEVNVIDQLTNILSLLASLLMLILGYKLGVLYPLPAASPRIVEPADPPQASHSEVDLKLFQKIEAL
ncbi:MAG: hypothetical protein AAFV07_19050, partial [Bacteroidota bacterium]